jgi:hypothetical protein
MMQIIGILFFVATIALAAHVIGSMLIGHKAEIVAALRGDGFEGRRALYFLYFQPDCPQVIHGDRVVRLVPKSTVSRFEPLPLAA